MIKFAKESDDDEEINICRDESCILYSGKLIFDENECIIIGEYYEIFVHKRMLVNSTQDPRPR